MIRTYHTESQPYRLFEQDRQFERGRVNAAAGAAAKTKRGPPTAPLGGQGPLGRGDAGLVRVSSRRGKLGPGNARERAPDTPEAEVGETQTLHPRSVWVVRLFSDWISIVLAVGARWVRLGRAHKAPSDKLSAGRRSRFHELCEFFAERALWSGGTECSLTWLAGRAGDIHHEHTTGS